MNEEMNRQEACAVASENEMLYHIPAARRAYSSVGLGMLLFVLVPQLLALLVQAIAAAISPAFAESVWCLWLNQIFSLYMVGAPLALLVIGTPPADLPQREQKKVSLPTLLLYFCIAQAISVVGSLISTGLTSLLGAITGKEFTSPIDSALSGSPMWMILLVVVIIGPIVEELICRAAIMRRLLPYGEKSAIIISALCFAVMHGNFFQLFYAFGLGLLLGYLYARTNRLSYVCLLHIVFNFFGSVVVLSITGSLDLDAMQSMLPADLLAYIGEHLLPFLGLLLYEIFLYGTAIVGLIFFFIYLRRIYLAPAALPLPKKGLAKICFGNAGMILFFIVGTLLLLLSLFVY